MWTTAGIGTVFVVANTLLQLRFSLGITHHDAPQVLTTEISYWLVSILFLIINFVFMGTIVAIWRSLKHQKNLRGNETLMAAKFMASFFMCIMNIINRLFTTRV